MHGGAYPFKLYRNGATDVTSSSQASLTLHYGQWGIQETPISFKLHLGTLSLAPADTYQLRIPMLKHANSVQYALNAEVYVQRVEHAVTPSFPINLTSYSFRNYDVLSASSPTTTTFVTVQPTGSNINRAQSSAITFDFALSSLPFSGSAYV